MDCNDRQPLLVKYQVEKDTHLATLISYVPLAAAHHCVTV